MLDLVDVRSGYGETQVLHGLSLAARPGRVLAVLGRNGAGKSTTLKTIMGLLPCRGGEIRLDGAPIAKRPFDVARDGIAYVPETRDIFPSLTVRENLDLAARRFAGAGEGRWTLERVLDLFPRLGERMENGGTQLSGGEQQMLAIARILRTGSRFLLLDEPSEGLAPVVVKEIGQQILRLKERGYTILLVEQNLKFAQMVADRHVVVEHGQVVDVLAADQLQANMARVKTYLGV